LRGRDEDHQGSAKGCPPGREEIEQLTLHLNVVAGAYQFAKKFAYRKPQLARLQEAFETLVEYFEERRDECYRFHQASEEPFESELVIYNKFWEFMNALEDHPFHLRMDAGTTVSVMPDYDDWHDVADFVAQTFRTAMRTNNPNKRFGRSNDGPVPRFVAAVMPTVTGGEAPSVGTVAQYLKRSARKRKQSVNRDN
jgi:hypothetical protein